MIVICGEINIKSNLSWIEIKFDKIVRVKCFGNDLLKL